MRGRRRPQPRPRPQPWPCAGRTLGYLGRLLSPGGKSPFLCPRQAWGRPKGLSGGMDHGAEWEAQVRGTAHVGPGERELCCGHGLCKDAPLWLPSWPRLALVPTEHPASFGPNQRVWGLHSPLLSSPLQHSFPSCTRMAPESFCACSPHPHDGGQTRSFSSVYVFFSISMKKSLMNKIPFEADLPRCRDMSIGISHRKPDGTSFSSSSRLQEHRNVSAAAGHEAIFCYFDAHCTSPCHPITPPHPKDPSLRLSKTSSQRTGSFLTIHIAIGGTRA